MDTFIIRTVFSLVSLSVTSLICRLQSLNLEMKKEKDFSSTMLPRGNYSTISAKYPGARTVDWSTDDSVKQDSFVGLFLFISSVIIFFSGYFPKLFALL